MATKPTPGGSDGTYGTELNAFLDGSLAADGKVKTEALQTDATAPSADAALANKKYVDDQISTYRVKGWVRFNATDGGAAAISDHYNVSGVVRNGVGDFTISWDTDFANANYCTQVAVQSSAARIMVIATQAAGTCQVKIYNVAGAASAAAACCVLAIGDQ